MSGEINVAFESDLGGFFVSVDFSVPARGVTAIFGHSGSGKTTLLRMVAGLHRAEGRLIVDGEVWQDWSSFVPVHQRSVAYVFQEASLFPHLSVMENLEYGYKRLPASRRKITPDQVVSWMGLESLLARSPDRLSGGERQRVAIGRALLTSPRLLLMDEPLSALDIKSRHEILPYLQRLHTTLDIPVLYVTHSPDEVARLADQVVVMSEGRVVQQGGLNEVFASLAGAEQREEDAGVVIQAVVAERDECWHLCRAVFDGGELWLSDEGHVVGDALRVRILARDVSVALARYEGQSMQNLLSAEVEDIHDNGVPGVKICRLRLGTTSVLSRLTARAVDELGLGEGQQVWMQVKSVAIID